MVMGTPYKCECGWFDSTQDHYPKTLFVKDTDLRGLSSFLPKKNSWSTTQSLSH